LADGEFRHVDPGSIAVGRVNMAIGAFVLIMIALLGLMVFNLGADVTRATRLAGLGLWLGLVPVLGIYCWFWPRISYRRTWYCLKEDCLIIRSGVFWKMETMVPKSRIQHTDISQGPLQRSYGISDLIIHTAGTRFAIVALGGLAQDLAPRLRNHLLNRTEDVHTL
jgi:membrane protein YdbS with pleckstrin-like domain